MLHVLLGHAIRFPSFLPMANLKTLKSDGGWLSTYFGAFWNVHPVAVDTFFAIGGMLLTRSMLSQIDRKRLNIPKLYLHRYLRITPVLAFLILIVLSINKFFGDGPFYKEHLSWIFNENCEKNWWVPFFHIQNYYVPLEYVSDY
jgi:peptidoglycan/LPS O-acetylase OafA/YrhL